MQKKGHLQRNHFLISRSDNIGDVILTLPMCGILKKEFPNCEITFLGKTYTKPIIKASNHIDHFIDFEALEKQNPNQQVATIKESGAYFFIHVFPTSFLARLAAKAKIPVRVGTTGRIYNWLHCNKLLPISRRRSNLHEAQLNIKLLSFLKIKTDYSLSELPDFYGISFLNKTRNSIFDLQKKDKFNIIIHPKSKGSAREWGIGNFNSLIETLPGETFRIFITGTEQEGEEIKKSQLPYHDNVIDLTGKMSLSELCFFIAQADALIACSTGPLHLAAAAGIAAIGIYPPIKPMHPGRWAPIGKNAWFLVKNTNCSACRKETTCQCIKDIKPLEIKNILMKSLKIKNSI